MRGLQIPALLFFTLECLPLPGLEGGFHELPLQGVHLVLMVQRPHLHLRQARAAVENIRLMPLGRPFLGRVREVTMQPQALAVIFKPAPQGRPFPYQRLVRHLHRILGQGDQPCFRKLV